MDCNIGRGRHCPAGIDDCPVRAEAELLRQECDRLSQMTQVDPLTGLFNFHHLMRVLPLEMERTRRTGFPTGILMIDLDHFKRINDYYGHQTGNEALRWVSDLWRTTIRQNDVLCRYGGEEFTLILPASNLRQTIRTAERLRKLIEESPLKVNGSSITLTASFGADIYKVLDTQTPDDFLARADQYLLEAKSNGRNRVCSPESTGEGGVPQITAHERAALFITRWPK